MGETNATLSEWEWSGIVNNPARKAAAEQAATDENKRRAEKEARLCEVHRRSAERRKAKMASEAFLYLMASLAFGVIAKYAWSGGIPWFGWTMVITASILGAIACFGFGRAYEVGRK